MSAASLSCATLTGPFIYSQLRRLRCEYIWGSRTSRQQDHPLSNTTCLGSLMNERRCSAQAYIQILRQSRNCLVHGTASGCHIEAVVREAFLEDQGHLRQGECRCPRRVSHLAHILGQLITITSQLGRIKAELHEKNEPGLANQLDRIEYKVERITADIRQDLNQV